MSDQGTPQGPEPAGEASHADGPAASPRRGLGTGAKAALIAVGAVALLAVAGIGGYAIGNATADLPEWHTMAEHGPEGSVPNAPGQPRDHMGDGDGRHADGRHADGRGPDGRGDGHHGEDMHDWDMHDGDMHDWDMNDEGMRDGDGPGPQGPMMDMPDVPQMPGSTQQG